ncbi:hypothetical protein MBANPS3_011620, partial [Mucor bainieri]
MKTLDDLPIEIHRVILDTLDLESLQNCLLVCRRWNKEIQSLAHKKLAIKTNKKLQQAISDYIGSSTNGRNVRDLILNIEPKMILESLCQLPDMFPNVKCVSLFHSRMVDVNKSPRITTLANKWKKLTAFNESAGFYPPLLHHFLEASNTTNLTSIKLRLYAYKDRYFDDVPDAYHAVKQVIPLLKNCPYLEHLTLEDTHVKADDIEELHGHVPRLESLHLKSIPHLQRAVGDSPPKHTSITNPAIRIKDFHLSTRIAGAGTPEERTHKDWLDFIAEKYPNLETLTFDAKTRVSSAHKRQQTHIQQLVKLARSCQRLRRLYIAFVGGFSEQLAAALEKSNIQLESANVHGSTDSTRDQLERLAKYHKDLKTLQILTLCRKKSEAPARDPYALGIAVRLFQNLQEVTVTKGFDLSYHHAAESNDYCSFKLLHSLLKYGKKLESISIEVGPVIQAFDEDMHTLSVAENLKKLAIYEVEYGLVETNYLNNVIFPNCPHLTGLIVKMAYCVDQIFNRNRESHPDVTYIDLKHQHHLKTMAVENTSAVVLLRVLPDEPTSATPKRWFRESGYELKHYDPKNEAGGRYTVLYLQPECLDAFLNHPRHLN